MSEERTIGGYAGYQSMVTAVSTALSDLDRLCEELKMEESRKALKHVQEKLQNHTFSVGIMGEFKRGKSTVINSLLEKEIMPADILPCSATMNRVTYDLHPHVQLNMRDGSQKDIPVEELGSYVTKLNAENESRAAEVDEAIVYYPCRFCQNGVDIVDTPGLNDDERMNKISEEIIPKLDAVIMVLTPDNPFSMSEAEFVRNKLMASDLSRLIFVVNKIDTIRREADRRRVIDGIREKIQVSVTEKMANVYGADSQEYRDAIQKMGKIRIYPLSALDALDGKLEGDEELVKKSGTVEFEAALTKMLTEDRSALELGAPLSVIGRTVMDITKTLNVRKEALQMSAEEFAQSQQEALEQIKQLREQKREEKQRLSVSAEEVKLQLNAQVQAFYPQLQSALTDRLDAELGTIDMSVLKNDAGVKAAAEQLQNAVSKEATDQLSLVSERLQMELEKIVGKEMVKVGSFVGNISDKLDGMNAELFKGKNTGALLAGFGAEAGFALLAGNVLPGIGGLLSGIKEGGIKGALVGGGAGFLASSIAFAVLASPAGFIGIPAMLIVSLVGSATGKFATRLAFGKSIAQKKLNELRDGIAKNIETMVAELRSGRELDNWCDRMVDQRYKDVIRGMEEETERLLKSTEESIDAIKQDMTENDMQRKQMEEGFDKILHEMEQITKDVETVAVRVRTVLEAM